MTENQVTAERIVTEYTIAKKTEDLLKIGMNTVNHNVDVGDVDVFTVGTQEAFAAIGEANEKLSHRILTGREARDEHPIWAIAGLESKLNRISELKTTKSDKKGFADYYTWEDENILGENRVGCFVSICNDVNTIKICSGTDDIFGVVVDAVAVAGGQDKDYYDYWEVDNRLDHKRSLVAYTGIVNVRRESDVDVGDYVMSNGYGVAKKSNNYGFKVIALSNIDGVDYAVISLNSFVNQIEELGHSVDNMAVRMGNAETNIITAINVANEAHKLIDRIDNVEKDTADATQKAEDALNKSNDALSSTEDLNQKFESVNENTVQAKAIADLALISAQAMRDEAVLKANEALTNASNSYQELVHTKEQFKEQVDDLVADATDIRSEILDLTLLQDETKKNITAIQQKATETDAIITALATSQTETANNLAAFQIKADKTYATIESLAATNNSIADFKQEASDTYATIESMTTFENTTSQQMATITQKASDNETMIQSLVFSIDKYSVGEFSQAYGLTQTQAASILNNGMIYIPTVNHRETYETSGGSVLTQYFTPGYYYTWQDNKWIESSSPLVAMSASKPTGGSTLKYWYVNSETAPSGYEANALYIWQDSKWVKVNILDGNVNNRISSMIRQTTNSISAEIVNARGGLASLDARLDGNESSINTLVAWKGTTSDTISQIQQKTNNNEANITTLTSWKSNVENDIKSIASIQQTANANKASIDAFTTWQGTTNTNIANLQTQANSNGAKIGLVVKSGANGNYVDGAVLVEAVNGQSTATIKADKINFTGFTTFLRASDLGASGTTTIDGARITTGKISADRIDVSNVITVGGIAKTSDIPKNTSALTNDSGFAYNSQIPTKVSQLSNDSGYKNESGVTSIVKGVITTDYVNALGITVDAAKINGKLTADQIESDSITTSHLTVGSVTNVIIANGAVEAKHVSADIVTANKLQTKGGVVIEGSNIKSKTLSADTITAGTLKGADDASIIIDYCEINDCYLGYNGIWGTGIDITPSSAARGLNGGILFTVPCTFGEVKNGTGSVLSNSTNKWCIDSNEIATQYWVSQYYVANRELTEVKSDINLLENAYNAIRNELTELTQRVNLYHT